jgi:hypothetical protein
MILASGNVTMHITYSQPSTRCDRDSYGNAYSYSNSISYCNSDLYFKAYCNRHT